MLPENSKDEQVIYDVTDGISSSETRKKYAYHFKNFLYHFEGITRESLLQKDVRVIEAMIIQWIKYLSASRKQKHDTIHNEVAAVLHFFEWNDIRLNKRKINRSIPKDTEVKQDRCYSHDEIWQILSKCDERNKVIVLLMASAGMRIGALPGLRLKDLHEIAEYNLYKVDVYARTLDFHYSFSTPECKMAIDEYRTFREVHGETIHGDSPLIRELFDTRVRFAAARPNPVKIEGLESLMHRLLKRSEVKSADVMRTHGLRKFAISMMIKADCNYNAREYLVGHKHSRGLDIHYDRSKEADRLAEFVKAIPLLTIDPAQRLKNQLQLQDIRHSEEWEALKREMNELRKFVYPGPMPRDKQMRKTYLKALKSHYKEEKGIDVDVSKFE